MATDMRSSVFTLSQSAANKLEEGRTRRRHQVALDGDSLQALMEELLMREPQYRIVQHSIAWH